MQLQLAKMILVISKMRESYKLLIFTSVAIAMVGRAKTIERAIKKRSKKSYHKKIDSKTKEAICKIQYCYRNIEKLDTKNNF